MTQSYFRTHGMPPMGAPLPDLRARQAVEYGYPRAIEDYEVRRGLWASNEHGVMWITTPLAFVHGIAAPGQRMPDNFEDLVRSSGRGLEVERVYAMIPRDTSRNLARRRLLRIRGWSEDGMGMYLNVWED